MSLSLLSCLEIPELRESTNTLDQDEYEIKDFESQREIDQSARVVSCGQDGGACLDAIPPPTDTETICEHDVERCQDMLTPAEDMEVMSDLGFSNTRSVRFRRNKWIEADASLLNSVLGRADHGLGAVDAWTISCYFYSGRSDSMNQTLLYYGAEDIVSDAHIIIYWTGNGSGNKRIALRYGTESSYLEFKTSVGSITNQGGAPKWYHLMFTYDGGRTGSNSGNIDDYYSRFKIFINGAQVLLENSHGNFGIDLPLLGETLRVGKYSTEGYIFGSRLDEIAIWDSDESLS